MGEEIEAAGEAAGFRRADFERFGQRLALETGLLREMVSSGAFSADGYTLGFEIECWILDHSGLPAPINQRVLHGLDDPMVVPELSRFNLELNCDPVPLRGDALGRAEAMLAGRFARCNAAAHALDANVVMIGTLPSIRDEDLTLENMSPLNRFYALNREVLRRRRGRALRVDIAGHDHLVSEHRDVMLEAATTSFQIHLKVPAALAHRYYNASIAASGAVLSACGNAPFLFGRSLWEETRIPLFEQAVVVPGTGPGHVRRVSMGSSYLAASCLECFEENLHRYPVLLPIAFDDPPQALRHLRLHNGTIWRWNRPLVGAEADGRPHLRIEHRILPAGPTILDMIANTALYLGLVQALAAGGSADGTGGLGFDAALDNFYAAARLGLAADLAWPGGGGGAGALLGRLLPLAERGLAELGVEDPEGRYLGIVEARTRSGRTGAWWQRHALQAHGGDVHRMMAGYCERQRSGAPVHEWDL